MHWQAFSTKWFSFYYLLLGCLFLGLGIYIIIKPSVFIRHLLTDSTPEHPPAFIRKIIKYWLLFTLPGLVLSFIPFSWPELVFSLWSLGMAYLAGAQLLRWADIRPALKNQPKRLRQTFRYLGVAMVAVSSVIFLLCDFVIRNLFE